MLCLHTLGQVLTYHSCLLTILQSVFGYVSVSFLADNGRAKSFGAFVHVGRREMLAIGDDEPFPPVVGCEWIGMSASVIQSIATFASVNLFLADVWPVFGGWIGSKLYDAIRHQTRCLFRYQGRQATHWRGKWLVSR